MDTNELRDNYAKALREISELNRAIDCLERNLVKQKAPTEIFGVVSDEWFKIERNGSKFFTELCRKHRSVLSSNNGLMQEIQSYKALIESSWPKLSKKSKMILEKVNENEELQINFEGENDE